MLIGGVSRAKGIEPEGVVMVVVRLGNFAITGVDCLATLAHGEQ